jgi:hypothetical protein
MHQLIVRWDANPLPVDGYNVYRGPQSDNATRMKLNTSLIGGLEFVDTKVFPGETYFYEVTAVRDGVESEDSLEVEAGPLPFPDTPSFIPMGNARGFAVLAGSTVTNTGPSHIRGDVGVSPGTAITGFDEARVQGSLHAGDPVAAAGQAALTQAFIRAAASVNPEGAPATILSGDIGETRLTPGVYESLSSLGITGTLILDAQGDPRAVFIFNIGSTLTLAGAVVLVDGAQAANVFWKVGSSATLGVASKMVGNVMAQASITANTGAAIEGRLLARTGAVTLDNNHIYLFQLANLFPDWTPDKRFEVGDTFFDCVSHTFQWVTSAGTSGQIRPVFSADEFTMDGTVVWVEPDVSLFALTPILPALPTTPPAPPAAPTGVTVDGEHEPEPAP